ncbi:MAG: Asp-tRNA(Asn)/Glu-tRNA(Gln) amidotransferase subunit GatC [Patescibacteria group bacterium]|nr:Asp-tRNA(Asn)/Glu-tRNA(Gln) amidotransferase subunit GatC [Patescibacteria group bacterium]
MSKINTATIEKLEKLTMICTNVEEKEQLVKNLNDILSYADMLNEVDTSAVNITPNINGESNKLREDTVKKDYDKNQMLVCSPLEVENNSIKVPKIL